MKKNFLIALCIILCITTIGCSLKPKYDTVNNQLNEEVDGAYDSLHDDYDDFADLTVYEDRFMREDNITIKQKYKLLKKSLKGTRYSKEKIKFNEKYFKLLSRVADKILSYTSEEVLIIDGFDYHWELGMDETPSLNLRSLRLGIYFENLNREDAGFNEGHFVHNSEMQIYFELDNEHIPDELYCVLREITSEFSKEEWEELIHKSWKDGKKIIIDIEDMKLSIEYTVGDYDIKISAYESYE